MFATLTRRTGRFASSPNVSPRRSALAGALIGLLVLAVVGLAGTIAVSASDASEPPVTASSAPIVDARAVEATHRAAVAGGAIRAGRTVRVIPLFDIPADQTGFGR